MREPINIELKWLPHGEGLPIPAAQSPLAAGVDLHAAVDADAPLTLSPGDLTLVPCGFAMALPPGWEAQVRPRSGLAAKFGVSVPNSPGTIDADYRGEVKVILINHGKQPLSIERGMRIAQMLIKPVYRIAFNTVETLDATDRGEGGFGHTGHA